MERCNKKEITVEKWYEMPTILSIELSLNIKCQHTQEAADCEKNDDQ